jgi:hypothetical protein
MYLQLTQNEVCKIPTNSYFWLPIMTTNTNEQIIWVKDGTDVGSLVTTIPKDEPRILDLSHIQSALNVRCLNYLTSTDWYITRNQETSVAIPADILTKRQIAREAIV